MSETATEIEIKDFSDLQAVLTKQNEDWGEFMRTNDERLSKMAKGEDVTELEAKLAKINEALEDTRKGMEALAAMKNRPAKDGDLTEEQQEHKDAFNVFLRKGEEGELVDIQKKALNTGSDPDGGVLVIPEMDMEIDRVATTISALGRLSSETTIGTNKWRKRVKTSGLAMRRVDDGSGGGETTNPQYALIEIEVHTAEVEPWVHNETLEDADVDLAADLAEEAAIGFGEGFGAEYITGNGVGKARGILAYNTVANASYAWGNVGYIASGASGAFAGSNPADKVIDLIHALRQQYRPGAAFITNDTTLAVMRQFKDVSGSYYLWNPDPAAGFGGRFLGHACEIDDNMPDIGAGSLSLAFGNWARAYRRVNRSGTALIRDNVTQKGNTLFNFRRRGGGGIINFEALKLMKFATS